MKTLVRYAASVNEGSNQTWDPVQHHPNLALGWLCERSKAAAHRPTRCCNAARRMRFSLRLPNKKFGEFTLCGTLLPFITTLRMTGLGLLQPGQVNAPQDLLRGHDI